MRTKRLMSVGAAVALALGMAASADARIVTVTYEGVVSEGGYDEPDGTSVDLVGAKYTAVYTINDAVPASTFSDPGPPPMSGISGARGSGYSSPVSAVVTIDGVAISLLDYGYAEQIGPGSGFDTMIYDRAGSADYESLDYVFELPLTSADYHTPFSITWPGIFSDDAFFTNKTGVGYDFLAGINSVTVAVVPEPATWAMLILGLAMIGGAARRRNNGVLLAARGS